MSTTTFASRLPCTWLGKTGGSFAGGKNHLPRPVQRGLPLQLRCKASDYSVINGPASKETQRNTRARPFEERSKLSGLARLPIAALLRNILLGTVFSSPLLSTTSFAFLRRIAESHSSLLNPDLNPLLKAILKPLLYDHFCAGKNHTEVSRTKDEIKRLGFSGVALCYGKETPATRSKTLHSTAYLDSKGLKDWYDGNMETLDMIDATDWLGVKFSGAGSSVTNALLKNERAPQEFVAVMDAICEKAAARGCRIWIDAEQQALQKGIDEWTIDLMRRYNRDGNCLVYNTLQAYLKESRNKLKHQLGLSSKEGWTLAIKLVRGAYMGSDERSLIHDTKRETDQSYDSIVHDLLAGEFSGLPEDLIPDGVQLLIAGHSPESFAAAVKRVRTLREQGQLKVLPEFAQLQGMGDVLGCRLLEQHSLQSLKRDGTFQGSETPKMYKCLTWGSTQECMQYLFRRAVENSGSTDRMKDGLSAYMSELKRRVSLTEST